MLLTLEHIFAILVLYQTEDESLHPQVEQIVVGSTLRVERELFALHAHLHIVIDMAIGIAILVLLAVLVHLVDRVSRNHTYLAVDDDLVRHTDAGEVAVGILYAALEEVVGYQTAVRLVGYSYVVAVARILFRAMTAIRIAEHRQRLVDCQADHTVEGFRIHLIDDIVDRRLAVLLGGVQRAGVVQNELLYILGAVIHKTVQLVAVVERTDKVGKYDLLLINRERGG